MDVLNAFGVRPEALLGNGGEAWVYALDDERVLRVLHAKNPTTAEYIEASARLTKNLARSGPSFRLPELLEVGESHGRRYTIEKRLPGRPIHQELERIEESDRPALVEAYLECASQLGDLALDDEQWWGDILRVPPVRTETWHGYLDLKASQSLAAAGDGFARIDATALASDLPPAAARSFVHLDAFAGNILATRTTVTAVIDFSATTLAGDRRLDPLCAAIYLTPEITPIASDRDRDVARSWLRDAGLDEWFEAARRWIAAYWAFAIADHQLHAWCRSVLL